MFAANCDKLNIVLLDDSLVDGTGIKFMKFATKHVKETGLKMPTVITIGASSIQEQKSMYGGYTISGYLSKPIRKIDIAVLISSHY